MLNALADAANPLAAQREKEATMGKRRTRTARASATKSGFLSLSLSLSREERETTTTATRARLNLPQASAFHLEGRVLERASSSSSSSSSKSVFFEARASSRETQAVRGRPALRDARNLRPFDSLFFSSRLVKPRYLVSRHVSLVRTRAGAFPRHLSRAFPPEGRLDPEEETKLGHLRAGWTRLRAASRCPPGARPPCPLQNKIIKSRTQIKESRASLWEGDSLESVLPEYSHTGTGACKFTDTVGFVQKLPTRLIASFRATLEEISDAQRPAIDPRIRRLVFWEFGS